MIENKRELKIYVGLLSLGIIYPAYFEIRKVGKTPVDPNAITYIAFSCVNIYLQAYYGSFSPISRSSMIILVLMLVNRTFFYLKVFNSLTTATHMPNVHTSTATNRNVSVSSTH